MGLIFATSTCAICAQRLDQPYTATSGVVFPESHPLWRYCDAPLHLDCLEHWPTREAFSRGYYREARRWYASINSLLAEADGWLLGCGPTRSSPLPDGIRSPLGNIFPVYAEVRLGNWPFRLYSDWDGWDGFVEGGFTDGLVGAALKAAEQVMAEVRDFAPDHSGLLSLWQKAAAQTG